MSVSRISVGRVVVKTNRPLSERDTQQLRTAIAAELSRVRSPEPARDIAASVERAGARIMRPRR
jgi:hypothetical protein